jgi:hypothetical protein
MVRNFDCFLFSSISVVQGHIQPAHPNSGRKQTELHNFAGMGKLDVPSWQPNLYAAVAVTLTAATLAISLRFAARRMTKVPLWWDDFMCVGAFVS